MKVFLANAVLFIFLLALLGLAGFALMQGYPGCLEYIRFYFTVGLAYWPVPLGAAVLVVGSLAFLSARDRELLKNRELDAYRQMDEIRARRNEED
jgi:hypothetical protein